MNQYTPAQLQDRFETLPDDVKKALASAEIGNALERIAQKHSLHIDQMGELNAQTTFIMLGLSPRTGYAQSLIDGLDITEEKARTIIEDINREIFEPIRTSLETIHRGVAVKDIEEDTDNEQHMPSREELLQEIENPIPTIPRQNTPVHIEVTPSLATVPTPEPPSTPVTGPTTSQEIPPQQKTTSPLVSPMALTIPPADLPAITPEQTPSILEQKLMGTMRLAPETTIEKDKPVLPQKPPTPLDPYRESVDIV